MDIQRVNEQRGLSCKRSFFQRLSKGGKKKQDRCAVAFRDSIERPLLFFFETSLHSKLPTPSELCFQRSETESAKVIDKVCSTYNGGIFEPAIGVKVDRIDDTVRDVAHVATLVRHCVEAKEVIIFAPSSCSNCGADSVILFPTREGPCVMIFVENKDLTYWSRLRSGFPAVHSRSHSVHGQSTFDS